MRSTAPSVDQQRAVGADGHDHRRAASARASAQRRRLRVVLAAERARLAAVRASGRGRARAARRRSGRAGAGLSTTVEPGRARRACAGQHRRVRHLEPEQRDAARRGARQRAPRPPPRDSSAFAPEATAIWFSPAASTAISATPVGRRGEPLHAPRRRCPPPRAAASASSPSSSSPTAPIIRTAAPARAAATAWLALLPPPWRSNVPPRHRLARAGQRLGPHHEVDVDRADHVDVARHRLG